MRLLLCGAVHVWPRAGTQLQSFKSQRVQAPAARHVLPVHSSTWRLVSTLSPPCPPRSSATQAVKAAMGKCLGNMAAALVRMHFTHMTAAACTWALAKGNRDPNPTTYRSRHYSSAPVCLARLPLVPGRRVSSYPLINEDVSSLPLPRPGTLAVRVPAVLLQPHLQPVVGVLRRGQGHRGALWGPGGRWALDGL